MLLKDHALAHLFDAPPPLVRLQTLNSLYDEAPELYDRLYGSVVMDLPFWKSCASSVNGEVLELGCGTGRVAIPLAIDGIKISGIDRSIPALRLAKSKADKAGASLALINGDFRSLCLGKRFDLIIAPANVINECFTPVDIDQCLEGIRRHLSPTGKLVMAVRNSVATGNTNTPKAFTPQNDEIDRGYKLDWQRVPYSHLSQLCLARVGEADPQSQADYYLAHRIYYPDELSSLLYRHGFVIDTLHGDYKGAALAQDSQSMVVTCSLG